MENLKKFRKQNYKNLKEIKGGLTGAGGGFVHTNYLVFGSTSVQDVFYDQNGNGKVDENERSSFSIARAD